MRGIYNYMIATIVGVMAMATPITSHAADATTTAAACWQEGIKAYENRQYGEAVEAFEKIVALGEASSEVYYNLANAYFKLGQSNNTTSRPFASGELGKAILNYHRAIKYNPAMADARYNLELAVDYTNDTESIPQSFITTLWHGLRNMTTSNVWAVTSLVMLAMTLILVMMYLLSANIILRKVGFFAAIVVAICFVIVSALAISSRRALINDNRAVVVCNDTTPVHASPDSASKIVRQPSQGVTIRTSRSHGEWTEIIFADGEMGWIRESIIEKI